MAYTDNTDLVQAAGGAAALASLADINHDGNATTIANAIAAAQARADGWIDFHARRTNAGLLPFGGGVLANVDPHIRAIAADETIYRLKVAARVAVDADHRLHTEREQEIAALEAGTGVVSNDPHELGSAATPTVVDRSTDTSTSSGADFSTVGFF